MISHSSPTSPESPKVLTYSVVEAAVALGVSRTTIYRLIRRRLLKPIAALRHKRISRDQLEAFAQGSDSMSK